MATDLQREQVAQVFRAMPQIFPDFVSREQQKSMMVRVLAHSTRDSIGLIEAPTGTGKSLAYLVPAAIAAISEKKMLVVSTATASLQDQLGTKDLPTLSRALEIAGITDAPLKFGVVKGRERHICLEKLNQLSSMKDMFENETAEIDRLRDVWDSGKWSGLRDTLPINTTPVTWAKVSNTAATCTGEACTYFDACPYYSALAQARESRVVVVNHDLLLSIMAHVPSSFLAESSNIFVFDEAHHLNDKLLAAFSSEIDLSFSWVDEFATLEQLLGKKVQQELKISIERMLGLWNAVANASATILGDASTHRFPLGSHPAAFMDLLIELGAVVKSLIQALADNVKLLTESAKRARTARDGLIALIVMRANAIRSELLSVSSCIAEFSNMDLERARWIAKGRHTLELHCSPFDASDIARTHLWPKITRCILTSATLTSLGSFDAICHNIGLPPDTGKMILDSPLDYSRARLIVPKFAVDATDGNHPAMVKAYLHDFAIRAADHMGVLCYFTNRGLMLDAYESLSEEDRGVVLLQGEWTPSAMIAEHKRRIDLGQRSVLYGLDTLSEGVDLPGSYCTRVIVQRIPFPSPFDPILATHAEHLISKGIEPFGRLTLPRAALKLAQVFGRLIRREGDHGDVMVLDRRLCTKNYGNQIVRSSQFGRLEQV